MTRMKSAAASSLARPLAVVAAAGIAAGLPMVLTNFQLLIATEILIFAVLAMSIDVLASFAGRVSLGHGAIFGVATYAVVYAVSELGISPVWAFGLGVLAATAAAAVFGVLAVRTSGVYFLLLTLALGMVVWGICLRWTPVTGGENGLSGDVRPEILTGHAAFYWLVLAVSAGSAWLMWRFTRSPFGYGLRGIRDSESRMRSLGYNVPLHLLLGFVASGVFAGVAGALYAFFNSFVSPATVSLTQSVEALLMVIAGGLGTLLGSFVGAGIVIILENAVSLYTERWQTVLGLAFILIMIFAPEGVVGKIRKVMGFK